MLMSQRQLCLLPTRRDDRGTALGAEELAPSKFGQFSESLGAEIAELVLLPVRPQVLHRIELRGIGGQERKLKRACGGIDVIAHEPTTMRREVIPDDEELPFEAQAQLFQELDYALAVDRARIELEVKAQPREPGDSRELVPVKTHLQHRGFAPRRPAAHSVCPLGESRLIDKHYRLPKL